MRASDRAASRNGLSFASSCKIRDKADGAVEERQLRSEHVAKQPGYPKRDIDTGPSEFGDCFRLDTRNAVGLPIPNGSDAEQGQGGREFLAAGAQRRTAPKIEHDCTRPLAVIGDVAVEDRLRRALAVRPGRRSRHAARIDAE